MLQIALQTPDVTGGTSPAATAKNRAFIARQPSTAPKSILRDTAYGRSHAPAATAQAAATHRRTSGVPATPEPECVSPTTSNTSIPPEILPQHPTEGNSDPRDRRQADHAGFEPAPHEVKDHAGQQPMVRAATAWQTAWTEELQAAASFDEFDLLVDRLIQDLSAEITPRRSSNQENAPPAHRTPAPNHNTTTRGARSRDASCRYDPAAASRIQKLYRANHSKATREILDEPSPYCTIPSENLYSYFKDVFNCIAWNDAQHPQCLRPLPRVDEAGVLETDYTPKEVMARLSKTKNTAPGKGGIPYSSMKKQDPGCLVLAMLFNQCKRFCRTPSSWKKTMMVLVYKKGERNDPSNWRPISLCSMTYKLYASCLASRITECSMSGGAISAIQKGFMSCERCYEHNFVLQATIEMARRALRQCTVAWLDLANAFWVHAPPPHLCHAPGVWDARELPSCDPRGVQGMQHHHSLVEGETAKIPIRSGVKQGCPLSPIIFNLAMEPLLRAISNGTDDFNLHRERVSVLAYSDDLVLTADDPENLQRMLDASS
ncbi:renalase isoform X1 [Chelonia mydas]|uniref:renalase isoform X1 n=1 Tax=Chelonia mydas TaxID=8469 RepID=UPI001CA96CE6|nr:renalase isoform X1 [Chelonia mydas]